jgi:hypothetical protein
LSIVPETFSYTLQELFELGIPPVATRVGSFADRIQDGVNGFLVEPTRDAVLGRLRDISQNRTPLKDISQFLRANPPRRMEEMLADYEAVIALPTLSDRAYFAANHPVAVSHPAGLNVQLLWKTVASPDFREESSYSVRVQSKTPAIIRLRIPSQSPEISGLRLDLGDRPGFIFLFRLRLLDVSGATVWSWQTSEGPLFEQGHDLLWLGGSPRAIVYSLGSDPHFSLPVNEDQMRALQQGGTLEIEMAWPSAEEAIRDMPSLVPAHADTRVAENHKLLLSHMATTSAPSGHEPSTTRLLHQLTTARARVDELEGSLSWRITAPLRRGGELLLSKLRAPRNGHTNG